MLFSHSDYACEKFPVSDELLAQNSRLYLLHPPHLGGWGEVEVMGTIASEQCS